jgi:hypothetical protein
MTDNGSAYRSKAFRAALTAAGARHKRTRPYTPRTNGKAERFIQTSLREWAYAQPYVSSQERSAALMPWLHHYNTVRRIPVWHNARQQFGSNPSCLVRPKGPLLRPDLRPTTTAGAGRARIAEGDRPKPARSVLAAARSGDHTRPRRDLTRHALKNVLGNDT